MLKTYVSGYGIEEQIKSYERLLDFGLRFNRLDLSKCEEGYPIYRIDYDWYVDVDVINDFFTHKEYLIWLVRQNELAGLEAYKMTVKQLEELLDGKELETYETTFWGVENDI